MTKEESEWRKKVQHASARSWLMSAGPTNLKTCSSVSCAHEWERIRDKEQREKRFGMCARVGASAVGGEIVCGHTVTWGEGGGGGYFSIVWQEREFLGNKLRATTRVRKEAAE